MIDLVEMSKKELCIQAIDDIELCKKRIKNGKRLLSKLKRLKMMDQIDLNLKRFYPYLLLAGISYVAFTQHGEYPFYQEEHPIYEEYFYTFTSNGYSDKVLYSDNLGIDKELIDTITYYEPWQEEVDNSFSQRRKIYTIAEKEKEHLLAYYDNPINCDYESFMYRFKSDHVNHLSYLSEEERNAADSYKALVYSKEESSNDLEEESQRDNVVDTSLYLLICSILFGVVFWHRKNNKVSFKDSFKELSELYEPEITEVQEQIITLKKELKKKKIDYIKKYY